MGDKMYTEQEEYPKYEEPEDEDMEIAHEESLARDSNEMYDEMRGITETSQAKENQPKPLEEWELKEIIDLLNYSSEKGKLSVLDSSSFYTHSETYGTSRRHITSYGWDGLYIQQIEKDQKYQQAVMFDTEEVPYLLAQLLKNYLKKKKEELDEAESDGLGDLDDHPF